MQTLWTPDPAQADRIDAQRAGTDELAALLRPAWSDRTLTSEDQKGIRFS